MRSVTVRAAQDPLWVVNLRSLGYTGYEPKNYEWGIGPAKKPLSFRNEDELDVSFVTPHAITELQHRNQKQLELPFLLNIISLGASDCKALAKFALPIANPRSRVVPTAGGNFVVMTPEQIFLYSPKFERLAELTLHDLSPTARFWHVGASPSGRSIFVIYDPDGLAFYHFEWIDPHTFRRTPLWTERLGSVAISDDHIAITNDEWLSDKHTFRDRLFIRALDGSSRLLCDSRLNCGVPAILNSDSLVLLLGHDELKVIRTDGQQLFDEKLPYETQWIGGPFAPSANGQRFAVPIYRPKGGWPSLDISPKMMLDKIVVYDIGLRGPVYSLDEKKSKITSSSLAGIALSPNGSELAVLADGILKVYGTPTSSQFARKSAD